MRATLRDPSLPGVPWRHAGALVAVWALAVVLVDPRADVPLIDDWTYAVSVEQLVAGKGFAISSWSSTFPAVQIWWGALFAAVGGFSHTVLRLSTLVLALAGSLALLGLLRALGCRPEAALLGALACALHPVAFVLSFSFMTDVPFVTASLASLCALVHGLRTGRRAPIALGLGLALAAFLIRPVAIALPAALLLTAALHRTLPRRTELAALALSTLTVMAGATVVAARLWPYAGEGGLAYRIPRLLYVFAVSPLVYAEALLSMLAQLGLAAAPVLLATAAAPRRWPWGTAVALGVAAALVSLAAPEAVSALKPRSTWSAEELGAARPLLEGLPACTPAREALALAATAVGLFGAACLLARAARALRRGGALRTPAWTCVAAFGAGSAGLCFVLWFFYDRYYLPIVPVAVALALAPDALAPCASEAKEPGPALRAMPAALALLALAALDVTGTRDMLAYGLAVSDAAARLEAAGVPHRRIDAGYVENGWHLYAHPENLAPGATLADVPHVTSAAREPYVVANTPLPGYRVRETVALHPFWAQVDRIYVLEEEGAIVP